MFNLLLTKLKYNHISILKKYNLHSHYRFHNADKYIADHKYEKIKNYQDFCTKPEEVQRVQLTMTQKQESYISEVLFFQRKGLAWIQKSRLFPAYRIDDLQLQHKIEGKTLLSFVKEGIKEKKPHQLLLFYGLGCFLLNTCLYFSFWYGAEDDDYIANETLNPEALENYSLRQFEPNVKEFKRLIGVHLQQLCEIDSEDKLSKLRKT